MRRIAWHVLLAALVVWNMGCVIVLRTHDLSGGNHIVEIDGELYVVDKENRDLRKIDIDAIIEEDAATTEQD